MLIIPAERKLDWKRPPWLTLALMLINILVLVSCQSDDQRLFQGASDYYQDAGLLEQELPVYESYLRRQAHVENIDSAREQLEFVEQLVADGQEQALIPWLLQDREFLAYAEANAGRYWQAETQLHWQQARAEIDSRFIDQLSSMRFGLQPARLEVADLVTYQFLHGGWAHLIGNMLILFLLGFTVEQALGGPRYLLAYLICGVFSGLLFALVEGFEGPPLVGASGSISGLMGMYIAIYGMQRIRFFYFLGFYFNYFRAPALVMLPVWAGKELWDWWSLEGSNVAYMAHLGGLLAGAGLVGLLGQSWLQVREAFHEPGEEDQEARFRREYGRALAQLEQFRFQQAGLQLEALWRRYPERSVLLDHLYQLAKLQPQSEEYRERALAVMGQALRQNRYPLMLDTWHEYQKLAGERQPLAAADHNRMLFAALREGDLKTAEKAFARLQQSGEPLLVEEACRLLVAELEKRQLGTRAEKYRRLMG